MPDLFDNPMGLCGFEFVEFASPAPGVLEPLFERMGFSLVARHRSKDVLLYRQGGINFVANREPVLRHSAAFRAELERFESALAAGDPAAIEALIASPSAGRGAWQLTAGPAMAPSEADTPSAIGAPPR